MILFEDETTLRWFPPLRVCGFGRAIGGECFSAASMMLDDWGLAEGRENNHCPGLPYGVPCPGNPGYYSAALKTYATSSVLGGVLDDRSATAIILGWRAEMQDGLAQQLAAEIEVEQLTLEDIFLELHR